MASLADYGLDDVEAALLLSPRTRVIYIIGDVDTGKTTFARELGRMLARTRTTARVDLDAGQASIGLPTTLAWAPVTRRGVRPPARLYFTGSTSPAGHMYQWLEGAGTLAGEARRHAQKVVVDACGLALGRLGAFLHQATADAIRADVIVAIERSDELGPLLGRFERAAGPIAIRLRAPDAARIRSRAERAAYRRRRLREYFKTAHERVVRLDRVAVLNPKPDPAGRIASLLDARGRDVALCIVREWDADAGTMAVLTPLSPGVRVKAVMLGSMRIARDGRQLAREV